jgi:hypothetical protein
MEPTVTERDIALLLMSEESWVTLGAVLALQAQSHSDDGLPAAMLSLASPTPA